MTIKKIIYLNKKEGETPLEALENFRKKNKKYKDLSITYAGRLDPMASGLLLLLAGEKVKEKENYLKLDKEYLFDVLFGFETDTYDVLGKIVRSNPGTDWGMKELEKKIKNNLKIFKGKLIQKYPIYSSKTVHGKPLFSYARSGKGVLIPEREVYIKELKFLKIKTINGKRLLQNIKKRVKKVGGDFRQKEILQIWDKNLLSQPRGEFFLASFKIKCGSGTYVRGIAQALGNRVSVPALAFSIKRTKIGDKKLTNF